jgi:branched-chain amino acid transport system substrate-binding protein
VCETAYDTKSGLECYEKLKGEALVVVPGSTGIAYELIPKAPLDGVPIVSMGYGPPPPTAVSSLGHSISPATYWSGALIILKYIADQERGESHLKGKKIALLYLNHPFGHEPIPILTEMAKKKGFGSLLYPVEAPGQDQDRIWTEIERSRHDWLLLWGSA